MSDTFTNSNTMSSPLFSVITITYNAAAAVEPTLRSVANQTFSDYEYIIIDGGSTDGTADLIRQYEDKITFWSSERDGGIYDAMNKGIRASRGEWLIFMNAGDTFYNESTLQNVADILKGSDEVVYGTAYTTDGRLYCDMKITPYKMVKGEMICHQSIFARRKTFDNNMFDTNYRIISDKIWLCRVLRKYKVRIINLTICCYDMTGVSTVNADKIDAENERFMPRFYGMKWRVISSIPKIKHFLKSFLINIRNIVRRK
ncbi:MAG: glycosyltransferase [Spirochaetales bacterium]|nr:glycosyltransferase [Spirochaetales bacterium]